MADEWDDNCDAGGKSFAKMNIGSYGNANVNGNMKNDDDDGWDEEASGNAAASGNGASDGWVGGASNGYGGSDNSKSSRWNGDRGGRGGGRGGRDAGGYRGDRNGGGYRGSRDGSGGYRGGRGRDSDGDRDGGGYRGGGRDGGGNGGSGGFRGGRGGSRDGGSEGGGYRNRENGGDFKKYNRNNDENGNEGDVDDNGGGGYRRNNNYGGRGDSNSGFGGRGGYRDRNNQDTDDNENESGGYRGRSSDGGSFRGGGGGGRGRGRSRDDNNESGRSENNGNKGEEKPREFYIPPDPSENENELYSNNITSGINFEQYDKIPIKVSGDNPPGPITSFETSNLSNFLLANIQKSGYTKPTPIQKTAIPIIMAKRDLMACAQTGSGKTAAFLLPIIHSVLEDNMDMSIGKPHVIIISPTRELASQIYVEALKFSRASYLKICVVYGGTVTKHQSSNVAKGCHILVATPGRLLDFVEKSYISFEDIRFVVLDEADRMLDMGFMPDVTKIMTHESMVNQTSRQTLMFSATFPEDIQRLAGQFLNNYIFITVGIVGGACTDVEQIIYPVNKFKKREKLLELIMNGEPDGTMVFVGTKQSADFLASFASEKKIPTTSIHGDRLQSQREEALRDFKSGKMKVLIATSVAARGLDIKNVKHVINVDLPTNIDDYVHRIGRTGRVGNMGKASSFYDADNDSAIAADLVRILSQAGQKVPDFLRSSGAYINTGHGERDHFGGKDFRSTNHHDDIPQNVNTAEEADEDWNE